MIIELDLIAVTPHTNLALERNNLGNLRMLLCMYIQRGQIKETLLANWTDKLFLFQMHSVYMSGQQRLM